VRVYKTSCQVFCLLKKFFGPKGQFLEEVLTKVLACFELHPVRNSALLFQIYNYYSAQLGCNILNFAYEKKMAICQPKSEKN